MLYLLQGIDGKYVRFSRKTQSRRNWEANEYLQEPDFDSWGEKGVRGYDTGKGKEKEKLASQVAVEEWMKEEEITGLNFVGQDGKVGV